MTSPDDVRATLDLARRQLDEVTAAVPVWLLLVAGGFTVGAWAATRLLHRLEAAG